MPIRYIETLSQRVILNVSRVDGFAVNFFADGGYYIVRAYIGESSWDMSKKYDNEEEAVSHLQGIYNRINYVYGQKRG